jgi:hypothetical protein
MNDADNFKFASDFISTSTRQPEFKAPQMPEAPDARVFRSVPYVCMHCGRDVKGSFAPHAPFCECIDYHWMALDSYGICPKCDKWWLTCGHQLPSEGEPKGAHAR